MRNSLTKNLPELCRTYKSALEFARLENYNITRYINLGFDPFTFGNYFKVPSYKKWIEMTKTMNPVEYAKGSMTYNYHHDQIEFARKLFPVLYYADIEHDKVMDGLIENYCNFLSLCKLYPKQMIVPSLIEDFVWHSHMTDHKSYVEDTTRIFGKILNHNTSDVNLAKNKEETLKLKESYYSNVYYSNCSSVLDPTNPLSPTSPMNPMSPMHPLNNYYSSCSISDCGSSCSSCGGD